MKEQYSHVPHHKFVECGVPVDSYLYEHNTLSWLLQRDRSAEAKRVWVPKKNVVLMADLKKAPSLFDRLKIQSESVTAPIERQREWKQDGSAVFKHAPVTEHTQTLDEGHAKRESFKFDTVLPAASKLRAMGMKRRTVSKPTNVGGYYK